MAKRGKSLIYCSRCGLGIGTEEYKSSVINGSFCTSDCYVDTVMDEFGIDGLMGRFTLTTDRKGGVELV